MNFESNARTRELWRDRTRVAVTPKVFDVLLLLVRSGGNVITRESSSPRFWRDAFVEESNLTQTIFMLRKALGRGEGERYILTIPGKG
jgi:DNA-binding winged helix-turn-helix (wHTH) protein